MDVRKLAIEAVEKIIDKKGFTQIVVNDYLRKFVLSDEDRAFFTKLTYGTVENLLTIAYYLEPFIGTKRQKPWIKYLLYISVYQLVYLKTPEYAVINEAVNIANVRDRAVGGFINAVLRNFLRNPLREIVGLDEISTLSLKYSYPAWLVAYLLKDYSVEQVEKIFKEFALVKKTQVRINTLKTTKEEVLASLANAGYEYKEAEFVENGLYLNDNIVGHQLLKSGKLIIQDLSSQRVSEVLAPRANSNILDACSAPGGKASHLSALMKNTGTIHACDIHQHKIKLMEKFFTHNGALNIKTQLVDARNLKQFGLENTFDYILVDAPCSGLGVMGHKVDLKYQLSMDSIEEVIKLQNELIESTWDLLKKNGYFVYSTCTLNKEENEEQIENFLKTRDDVEIISEEVILPYEYQSAGFYICKLRKL